MNGLKDVDLPLNSLATHLNMNAIKQFEQERSERMRAYALDADFAALSSTWLEASMRRKYVYNFDWMGRPIIQYPQDMVAAQELIWKVRPDLIIETGIAHGGSLVLSASMLAMLDICDAIEKGATIDPRQSKRKVIGVDIDIRPHNRDAIEAHPMASRIHMIQGSSIDPETVVRVRQAAEGHGRVMVFLDSMHTHDHVLAELQAYAGLVSVGSYCVVFDTFVEDVPANTFVDRPWGPGNSPMTAVLEYMKGNPNFQADRIIEHKIQITVAPHGFLRRVF
jgi:cephalosporin hydroxylase